jgi:hypothetical protein
VPDTEDHVPNLFDRSNVGALAEFLRLGSVSCRCPADYDLFNVKIDDLSSASGRREACALLPPDFVSPPWATWSRSVRRVPRKRFAAAAAGR